MNSSEPKLERYFPSGAIAFFIAVIAVYVAIWFLFYVILVDRGCLSGPC